MSAIEPMVVIVEYAEWQKTQDEYGKHYIVYQIGGLADDECYYVVELDEGYLISKVVGPRGRYGRAITTAIDLDDPKQLCFGCDMCDGHDEAWFNTKYYEDSIPETCRHREAVITVLKRRRVATKEDDYRWVITFAASSERRPYQKGKDMIMR